MICKNNDLYHSFLYKLTSKLKWYKKLLGSEMCVLVVFEVFTMTDLILSFISLRALKGAKTAISKQHPPILSTYIFI